MARYLLISKIKSGLVSLAFAVEKGITSSESETISNCFDNPLI